MGAGGFDEARIRVPGYVTEALLGSGSTSRVWRGRAAGSGDPVALKYVELRVDADAGADVDVDVEATQRARTEAALLAALEHPNLVRLHEFVPVERGFVLVLDLAAGGSLAQLLAARGRLSPGETISALAPIGAALAHVHDAGIVHGDVSPANVLFTDDGTPMLADLGVARMLGERHGAHTTPAYVDPGVAAGFVPTPHSDVFMLAGVALHLLTGAPTWRGDTASATLIAALNADLSDLDERLRGAAVPEAMAEVVRRALAVEPPRRGSAAEFALDLRHAGQPVAVELAAGRARPPALAEPLSPPPASPAPPSIKPTVPPAVAPTPPVPPPPPAPEPAAGPRLAGPSAAPYTPPGHDDEDTGPLPVIAAEVPAVVPAEVPAEVPVVEDLMSASPAQTRAVQAPPRPRTGERTRPSRLSARPRTKQPRGGRRRAGRRRQSTWWDQHRRLGLGVLGAAAALAVGLGVALGVSGGGGHARPGSASTPGSRTTIGNAPLAVDGTVESLASAPPPSLSGGTAAPSTTAPPITDDSAATLLVQLDALREGAFARRAPLLLTGVYEPGALLDEDTSALQRIVPEGCGLEGVHTAYTGVRVLTQTASSLTVSATATLAQSVLFCNGVAKATAPGAGPNAVRITLQRSGSGWLISQVTS